MEIMKDHAHGHSLSQLIDLPNTFSPGSKSHTSVYIHNPRKETLLQQLKALSMQTVQPESIIIYVYNIDPTMLSHDIYAAVDVGSRLFPDNTIHVIATSESFETHGRFQSLLDVSRVLC